MEVYLHSPNMPSWRGAQLKHKDNLIFITVSQFSNKIKRMFSVVYIYVFIFNYNKSRRKKSSDLKNF
jgi:hypothetical protein